MTTGGEVDRDYSGTTVAAIYFTVASVLTRDTGYIMISVTAETMIKKDMEAILIIVLTHLSIPPCTLWRIERK